MSTTSMSRAVIGPVLALCGGIVLAMASFAYWVSVSDPNSLRYSEIGTEVTVGWITVVLGVVLLAIGALSLRSQTRLWSWASIIVGGVGVAVGIWEIANVKDLAVLALEPLLPPEPGISVEENRVIIEQSIEQAGAQVSIGIGLVFVVVGGISGVLAGLYQLSRFRLGSSEAPPSLDEASEVSSDQDTPGAP